MTVCPASRAMAKSIRIAGNSDDPADAQRWSHRLRIDDQVVRFPFPEQACLHCLSLRPEDCQGQEKERCRFHASSSGCRGS